ncbi:DUF2786 domain-containing protein [Jiangella ureilytica]|uniref:DUF2786 domain-containing protein n=1 Tax=Jiangella ureilytica TaxID=2530374 RepID=A0A4R4RH91_9ACTN|nr:DUF2786 domain-containing protein [Jiangella ureilytica]TDC48674.1 DUF2786 domain-containing protein [Jiangella ureilytica]
MSAHDDDRQRPGSVTAQVVADWLTTVAADGLRRGPEAVLAGLRSVSDLAAPRVVDAGVAVVLRAQVDRLWSLGWLPVDLVEVARRQGSALAAAVVVDAMADAAQQYPAASVHPRWLEQLRSVGAGSPWWNPGAPYPGQWTARHGADRETLLAAALELVGVALRLPALQVIVPPPGRVSGAADRADGASRPRQGPSTEPLSGPSSEKMLSRVRALLAKAESTQFPDEAEALSAKAQELMSRYSIEQALAEPVVPGRRTTVASARRIWLEAPYLGPKTLLVAEVGSANHCRTVSSEKLGFVTVLGAEVDLDVVEVLSTSLLVQAARAMLASGTQYTRLGTSRTRSFRHAFLLSYATRIGERLREAAAQTAAATGTDLVPVLAGRAHAVDTLFTSLFATATVRRSFSAGNAAGWGAGRSAADRAVLATERRAVRRSSRP